MAEDKNLNEEEIMNEETVEEVAEECDTTEEVTEDTECEAGDAECEDEDKKGFFKKNKKDKKDPKDIQIEELSDKYRRTMAEFDNFRKRTEKEKATMYEIGAKDIINKLLPVVDNFERGLASIPEADKGTPVADGMDKIYRQLTKMLEEAGVKEIEAEGQEFNPDFHNAVMHIEDETLGENVVAEVLLKGYTYRDSVVRHSMVKVAN